MELLVALIVLFASAPFVEALPEGDMIEAGLITVVMIAGVVAAGGNRRSLLIAVLLVLPTLACKWGNHFRPNLVPAMSYYLLSLLFFGFVIVRLLTYIIGARHVDLGVLCAAISGFLIVGLTWSLAYLALARFNPAAFNLPAGSAGSPTGLDNFSAFYFSFITLCTVGYGDITPASNGARMLAVMEAIFGLFYMAVIISRLVSVYSTSNNTASTDE